MGIKMKIVKEGLWVIVPAIVVPILLIWLTGRFLFALIFILTAIFIFFFRDPTRIPPFAAGILSPADGRIIQIDELPNELVLFIELSLINCHLQRSPIDGTVSSITRIPGKHRRFHIVSPILGFTKKKIRAAGENARNVIEIDMDNSKKMWISQIVGAFARRCKSFVKVGQKLQRGDKIGLIYFGSMVKLKIQGQYELKVKKEATIKAGQTIIALPKEL